MIEKCQNFRRAFSQNVPGRSVNEVSWCTVKGSDMQCGGFSDHCPIPDNFKSDRGIPNEQILFKRDIDQMREDLGEEGLDQFFLDRINQNGER